MSGSRVGRQTETRRELQLDELQPGARTAAHSAETEDLFWRFGGEPRSLAPPILTSHLSVVCSDEAEDFSSRHLLLLTTTILLLTTKLLLLLLLTTNH